MYVNSKFAVVLPSAEGLERNIAIWDRKFAIPDPKFAIADSNFLW